MLVIEASSCFLRNHHMAVTGMGPLDAFYYADFPLTRAETLGKNMASMMEIWR
jgi:hypothetical protein